ncbi:unnamed protein product, partial [Aphanomyces euteiches]
MAMRDIYMCQMKSGKSVSHHLANVSRLVGIARQYGCNISCEDEAWLLVLNMDSKYTSMSLFQDINGTFGTRDVENLKMKIEDEERRHSDMRGGRRDHEQWRRNDHALRVGQLQCYNCQGFGHKTPDCPSIESFDQSGNVKKKNKSKKHGQKQRKAIETPSDGANLVVNVRGNDKNTAWFGDSGATLH